MAKKLSENDKTTTLVVQGPCILTKNPCVKDSDIRKVETLTKEKDPERFSKLSHLFNVIVFPSKGK